MLRKDTNGLVTYHFESEILQSRRTLDPVGTEQADAATTSPPVIHAVFTRLGGVSRGSLATLNVGSTVGDDEAALAENHKRIFAHLGLSVDQVSSAHQVHGNRVGVVTADDGGRVFPSTDGLVTDVPGIALFLRFADCQPILLYDPVHHTLGLVHAGWRGVALNIARRAVETMQETFGTEPLRLIAGLGPAIGPCCYTLGHKAAAAMGYVLPHWRRVMSPKEEAWRFDLPAANAQQLAAAGVRHIEQAALCTSCHKDEFFSHRGDNGQTGRFAVVAYLQQKTGPTESTKITKAATPKDTATIGSVHPPGFPAFEELKGNQ